MKEWQTAFPCDPPLKISVNLSSKQFLQLDLAAAIKRLLSDVGLAPRTLKLEITESAIMDDPDSASTMLAELRALGVQVCIDDFGTGYSSLNYLHRFAVDTLKIDRSFVQQMDDAEENMQIVQSIVGLAHNLSIDVIAEGVETEAQRSRLAALSCEYGQGYYFSRPVDSAAARELLAAGAQRPDTLIPQ
jgi:EAL domain-containing protein (putative c-di-GMP-specific phosphodiesterase class I)